VDLQALMEWLGRDKVDSVLIEGGGQVHEAALRAGIVNHVCAYIAPKLLGGKDAKTPVEGLGAAHPDQAAKLENLQITHLGEDLLLEYDVTGGFCDVYWNR
jgi:diaminohydroxyphosphoribosylaminopyrimidine deaminase/5-amino-6-(5-phosphoribosylamino)uracil reductase